MDDKEGGDFSLWGGEIYGTNTKVVPEKLLEQDWYSGKWDKPSKAIFTFNTDGDKTIVKLVNSNLPDNEAEDVNDGWKEFYLGPIKELLENN